jgi:hypothetical protein
MVTLPCLVEGKVASLRLYGGWYNLEFCDVPKRPIPVRQPTPNPVGRKRVLVNFDPESVRTFLCCIRRIRYDYGTISPLPRAPELYNFEVFDSYSCAAGCFCETAVGAPIGKFQVHSYCAGNKCLFCVNV